jgi:putative two-component system response regulator
VDYITKPINPAIVLARVHTHLELKQARDRLAFENEWLEREVARRMSENLLIQDLSVRALACLSEARDNETGLHIVRTQTYVELLARHLESHDRFRDALAGENLGMIVKAAPLHDVGKVGVPDSILLKPGRLTDDERLAMQGHVELGGRLIDEVMEESGLISSPYLSVLHNLVLCHHEFLDGSGYPRGLSGDAVPLEARIVTIADIFDALTSERPYKKPWSHQEALAELRRMADAGKLDRHCVEAIAAADDEVRAIQARFGLTA